MGVVEQAIVVGMAVDRAAGEWKEFVFRDEIGTGRGPARDVELSEAHGAEQEMVEFTALDEGSTRVVLRAEYDEDDEDVDVSSLRADVNDELARFREFVEGRQAA